MVPFKLRQLAERFATAIAEFNWRVDYLKFLKGNREQGTGNREQGIALFCHSRKTIIKALL
ncbi:hypothetical protein COO91_08491 [Nostoc flagelliforme CCNUN1]|uniref:Uncharacterized protein n=1 Tax=Nostoc flagelliforme CCNUN1 TaxID=2038116 RepID=A0A2K8T3R8_9NOSO|nr:hypothetical protein COO91_08491 [Nostoc flagelliforme CCNUN1]